MSKSKSRQPSKQASSAAKGTVKLAENAQVKLAENDTREKQSAAAPKQAPAASTANKSTPPPVHRPLTRDGAKYERRQAERQSRFLAQRRARRRRNTIIAALALVVILAGSLTGYYFYNAHQAKANGANNLAPFTEAIFNSDYQPVDNIYCDQLEGQVEHIHAHLSIYINGQVSQLPANVGIPTNSQTGQSTCFYWLHVHDASGVIHIEAPVAEPFTLSQFLDEWNQQFNSLGFPQELLLDKGWTIWVNGKPFNGSFKDVPLDAHSLITIAYGDTKNVKPDKTYNWGTL